MKYEELEVIELMSGCGKPCNYLEYKFHRGRIPSSFDSGDHFVFSLLAQTRYTSVEKEELLYPSSTMVAEVGGTLGLFLGVSFMTIWDGAISMKEYLNLFKSCFLESHFKKMNKSSRRQEYVIPKLGPG